MTEQFSIDESLIERFYEFNSQNIILDLDHDSENKMKEFRIAFGMSEFLAENLKNYFSSEGRIDRALNHRPIPIEMRETECKFEKLIERADELFIAFYKREKNKCETFLTEIEVAFDSTNLRIMILSNIYDEGCDLYARYFP